MLFNQASHQGFQLQQHLKQSVIWKVGLLLLWIQLPKPDSKWTQQVVWVQVFILRDSKIEQALRNHLFKTLEAHEGSSVASLLVKVSWENNLLVKLQSKQLMLWRQVKGTSGFCSVKLFHLIKRETALLLWVHSTTTLKRTLRGSAKLMLMDSDLKVTWNLINLTRNLCLD